jgi:hypothetical protein
MAWRKDAETVRAIACGRQPDGGAGVISARRDGVTCAQTAPPQFRKADQAVDGERVTGVVAEESLSEPA